MQAELAAAEIRASKLTQELEQRQADNAVAVSAAEDRCRHLEAAVKQVSFLASILSYSLSRFKMPIFVLQPVVVQCVFLQSELLSHTDDVISC